MGKSIDKPGSGETAEPTKNRRIRRRSGTRRVTIYDVAKAAGVSTFTVSSVLNGSIYVSPELTKRVKEAAEALDYTKNDLARSAQKGHSRTIGMLIPDIANAFYASIVRAVEDVLRRSQYSLILGNTYNQVEEQSRYISVFRSKRVDGILLFAAFGDQGELRKLVERRIPVCFIARGPIGFEADLVAADNLGGTRRVTQYLLSKGHERIAIITGPRSLTTTSARLKGWRSALETAGLAPNASYIGESDLTSDSGYRLATQLLDLDAPPTAIFVTNLTTLIGVLRALKDRRLPKQPVEVVASDEAEWLDVFDPPIPRIDQRSYEMGEAAAELLLERIQKPDRAFQNIRMEPKLKVFGADAGDAFQRARISSERNVTLMRD
jgi:LacI family transcriptional regulator